MQDPHGILWGSTARARQMRAIATRVRLVELQDTFVVPPRAKGVAAWRQQLPETLGRTCRAWGLLTHVVDPATVARAGLRDGSGAVLAGPVGELHWSPLAAAAWARCLRAALDLGCTAIVFETPASFTPTDEHRRRLATFFESVQRPPAMALVWEPHGAWTAADIATQCRTHNVLAAIDPLLQPEAARLERLYFKLRGAYYGDRQLDQLVELASSQQPPVHVVFATGDGVRDALRFGRLLHADPQG